jgi:hypothetical protein
MSLGEEVDKSLERIKKAQQREGKAFAQNSKEIDVVGGAFSSILHKLDFKDAYDGFTVDKYIIGWQMTKYGDDGIHIQDKKNPKRYLGFFLSWI